MFVVIVIGFSLATSTLFLSYRDLNQVWDVVVQAGFFVAPIVFPLSIIPERFHAYLYALAADRRDRVLAIGIVSGDVPSGRAHALW